MKKETGNTYESAAYAKGLFVSEAKVGKTSFLLASSLGVLPWQTKGGLVDRPENLHVFSFDSGALSGAKRFLTQTCNAHESSLGFRVYNFQEDCRRVALSESEYDYSLFNSVLGALEEVETHAKKGGVHVLLISSLTGLAQALERAIAGPPGAKRGNGMDQSKWQDFGRLISDLRNHAQIDSWHCLWEAHIYKSPASGQIQEAPKESLQVSGKTGQNFAFNVEQVFRIRRNFGQVAPGTRCEQVYLDTRPTMDCIANGRGFTENLEAKEYDLTAVAERLGLKTGNWKPPTQQTKEGK